MKKVFPLLLIIMFAFVGCQRGPATYEMAESPQGVITHAKEFVGRISKQAKNYNAEDWEIAISQFVQMGKNYCELKPSFTEEQQMQYDNVRMEFIYAVDTYGGEDMALRVKEEYSAIFE